MNADERRVKKEVRANRMRAIWLYREEKYPIYAWADHIYVALCFVALIVGIAYLIVGNSHWVDFVLLFLVAFFGGALMGKIEETWIVSWMKKDGLML